MKKSNKSKLPHFIPLNYGSQGNSENVLYYNANASPEALYECAMVRSQALADLVEVLHDYKNIPSSGVSAVSAVSVVVSLLLSDMSTLMEALGPLAMVLTKKSE